MLFLYFRTVSMPSRGLGIIFWVGLVMFFFSLEILRCTVHDLRRQFSFVLCNLLIKLGQVLPLSTLSLLLSMRPTVPVSPCMAQHQDDRDRQEFYCSTNLGLFNIALQTLIVTSTLLWRDN